MTDGAVEEDSIESIVPFTPLLFRSTFPSIVHPVAFPGLFVVMIGRPPMFAKHEPEPSDAGDAQPLTSRISTLGTAGPIIDHEVTAMTDELTSRRTLWINLLSPTPRKDRIGATQNHSRTGPGGHGGVDGIDVHGVAVRF